MKPNHVSRRPKSISVYTLWEAFQPIDHFVLKRGEMINLYTGRCIHIAMVNTSLYKTHFSKNNYYVSVVSVQHGP